MYSCLSLARGSGFDSCTANVVRMSDIEVLADAVSRTLADTSLSQIEKNNILQAVNSLEKIWAYGVLVTDAIETYKNEEKSEVILYSWHQINKEYADNVHIRKSGSEEGCEHSIQFSGIFAKLKECGVGHDFSVLADLRCTHHKITARMKTLLHEFFVSKEYKYVDGHWIKQGSNPPTALEFISDQYKYTSLNKWTKTGSNVTLDFDAIYGESLSADRPNTCAKFFSKGVYVYAEQEAKSADEHIEFTFAAPPIKHNTDKKGEDAGSGVDKPAFSPSESVMGENTERGEV